MECQEAILNSRPNKTTRSIFIVLVAVMIISGGWWILRSKSTYYLDLGNGVVIYADNFVETGKWVFDCSGSRLVSREPLPVPWQELKRTGKITQVINILAVGAEQKAEALKFIDSLDTKDYEGLRYLYSGLDEKSELRYHTFYLLKEHGGRTWVAELTHVISRSGNRFFAAAKPYDATTYVDHEKALKVAAASCPQPQ